MYFAAMYIFMMCLSCSSDSDPDPTKPATSDPDLANVVSQFKADAAYYNVAVNANIVATFTADASKPYMSYYSGSYKEGNNVYIFIVKNRFEQYGYSYKSAVYRELGEQILGRKEVLDCDLNELSYDLMCTMYCPCNDDGIVWSESVKLLFEN